MNILDMILQQAIRAAPHPKNCYICDSDKSRSIRYVIPSTQVIIDVYNLSESFEVFKHIEASWLCPDCYNIFDTFERHRYQNVVARFRNPSVTYEHSYDDTMDVLSSLSVNELYRALALAKRKKRISDTILSSINIIR